MAFVLVKLEVPIFDVFVERYFLWKPDYLVLNKIVLECPRVFKRFVVGTTGEKRYLLISFI